MSKATLWDVFDAAMGTAQLITGDIAKYKIEQDEAELRRFEIEQKKKMADFNLELQGKTDFDNFDKKYNEFMDKQEKDLMSRIKTNAGSKVAKEWFDNQRVNNQIQVDKIETSLRKNHIIATNLDSMKQNESLYQGQELYDRNKEIADSMYQDNMVDVFQYHDMINNLGNTVLDQRMNNIVDEAAGNCETLDQMYNYIDTNLNFNDLKLTKYSASGDGSDVDNSGVLDMTGYKDKAKELATGIWNTKVKRIQDSNANYIREEIAGMLGEIESNPQGVLTKIGQCFQYMNNNPGNKFNAKERQSLANDLDDLRKRLQKGDTKGAGTAVASMTLKKDLKAGDIDSFIADYKAGVASGYDVRNLVIDNMFKEAKAFGGFTGSKTDFVNENLSLNQKIIELLQDNIPDRAKGLSTAAENLCKSQQFKEFAKENSVLAGQIEEDLANFAVDLALETKWDGDVNTDELTKRLETRYNSLLLKTSKTIADTNIKDEKIHAQMLNLTTGEAGEEFVFTDKNGVQVWMPGGKQAIQKEGGLQQTGQNLISKIAGVSVENVNPSFKTTKGGNDISSEIQYRVGSDIYELKPSENGKKVDVYKNGENLGNAYDYNVKKDKAERKELNKEKQEYIEKKYAPYEELALTLPTKDLVGDSALSANQWRKLDLNGKVKYLEALKQSKPEEYKKYMDKQKSNTQSLGGRR